MFRAPRQWNETADHALTKEVGLWKHRLDGCIYLSTRLATKEDAEFEVFEHNGVMMIVDGVFGLHVDDILAAGEGVTKAEDAYEPQGEPKCYAERLYVLLNRFKFGSVDYQDKQMFCGCQLTQAMDAGSVTFDLEKYLHQLKPLSIEKNRKANPGEKATPKEQSQLRGLFGWIGLAGEPDAASLGGICLAGTGKFSKCDCWWDAGGEQSSTFRQGDFDNPLEDSRSWVFEGASVWSLHGCFMVYTSGWYIARWLADLCGYGGREWAAASRSRSQWWIGLQRETHANLSIFVGSRGPDYGYGGGSAGVDEDYVRFDVVAQPESRTMKMWWSGLANHR